MEDEIVDLNAPETSEQEKAEDTVGQAKVSAWAKLIESAKQHWEDQFKWMKEDQQFARGVQWKGQKQPRGEERYITNIVHRHLRQREAALYAKNPTAIAKRRETIDYEIWGGDLQELQEAQQTLMMAQQMQMQMAVMGAAPPPPEMQMQMQQVMQQAEEAEALLEDYRVGSEYRKRVGKMGKTLEIVYDHQLGEQQPPFKSSMKGLVRRTLTVGVAFAKLGYHRFNESKPEDVARVTDLTEQVAALEAAMMDQQDNPELYDENSRRLADLQDLLNKVQNDQNAFMREGMDVDYPSSTSIIVDPACRNLQGFVGARWIAQEYKLSPTQISETYKKDIGEKFTPYDEDGNKIGKAESADKTKDEQEKGYALVWEVYDKHMGQTLTICDGHPDYLIEPKTPAVQTERFWPIFTLMFNPVEDDENIYPPSDVELLRPMQTERNLMRQRVREHRDAARPGYAIPKGKLDDEDKAKLQTRDAHDVLEFNGLSEQDDIRRVLQAIPANPIDPNQYETSSIDEDVYRSVGTQEAVMGGTSGASATETSIGESARLSAVGSAVDDLDDFLTELTRTASQMLFVMMDRELVKEIAGRGAVWPDTNAEDVARDLWLEIRAGSSGRPNKSMEIQNLERVMPLLLQIPGMKPKKLAEKIIERLDDHLSIDELFDANLPSVMAQNRMDQQPTGDPMTDPNQQGAEGSDQTAVQQGDSNLGPRAPQEGRVMDPNRE